MSLHILGHLMTVAVLRDLIKGKLCKVQHFNMVNFAINLLATEFGI
jgi:hypothetical protein